MKIQKSKYKSRLKYILLFLTGFIVFSPISSFLTINILSLPLALPELLFIPFYFNFRKAFNLKPNTKILLIGLYFLVILAAIAMLVGDFPLTSILSTMRGYAYIILAFSIFINKPIANNNLVFTIALGASFGWMTLGLASMNRIIENTTAHNESLAVYGNMIALALAISIPIIYKKKLFTYIILFITIVITLTAGLRRQIAISFLSYILSFFTQLNLNLKRIASVIISFFIISFLIISFLPTARNFIEKTSHTLYVRTFVKTEMLLQGNTNLGDDTRLKSFNNFIDNFNDYLLPRGLVSKRAGKDKKAGLFMDSPYLEFFHTFGLFFSLPIIIYFFSSLFYHIKNYYKNHIKESAICLVMGGVILLLILIEGSFLNFVYTTPITGFVLARLASRRNFIQN